MCIFLLVITYLLITVVIPPNIEFASSHSICHAVSRRRVYEDNKLFVSLYFLIDMIMSFCLTFKKSII